MRLVWASNTLDNIKKTPSDSFTNEINLWRLDLGLYNPKIGVVMQHQSRF